MQQLVEYNHYVMGMTVVGIIIAVGIIHYFCYRKVRSLFTRSNAND